MQVEIFDVSHGFCACIIADSGNIIVIDCGYNNTTGFRPSAEFQARRYNGIEYFIVSNFDEDHLDDLPALRKLDDTIPINFFWHNKTVSVEALREIKRNSGGIGPGVESIIEMMPGSNREVVEYPDLAGIEIKVFYNSYPEFQDTNNLSVVTFLEYDSLCIVFPGDLERAGWEKLLQNQEFQIHLGRVGIFVASHHGRENGYCPDVFNYCKPYIVVISDDAIQYHSQETDYGKHAQGIKWNGGGTRRVLTTRKDGNITITKTSGKGFHINIG